MGRPIRAGSQVLYQEKDVGTAMGLPLWLYAGPHSLLTSHYYRHCHQDYHKCLKGFALTRCFQFAFLQSIP